MKPIYIKLTPENYYRLRVYCAKKSATHQDVINSLIAKNIRLIGGTKENG